MFGNIGTPEILLLLGIILLIFGPTKLPKLAQAIGKSVRELKNGMHGLSEDIKETVQPPAEAMRDPRPNPTPAANTQPVIAARPEGDRTETL